MNSPSRAFLSLILSLRLAAPVAAQTQSGAAAGSAASGGATGAAAAGANTAASLRLPEAPGLSLGAPVAPLNQVAVFLKADLDGLTKQAPAAAAKSLAGMLALTGPEAAYDTLAAANQSRSLIRTAVANPAEALGPGGRIALAASFGAETAARIQTLSDRINAAAATDPEVRTALEKLRRPRAVDEAVARKVLLGALLSAGKLKALFADSLAKPAASSPGAAIQGRTAPRAPTEMTREAVPRSGMRAGRGEGSTAAPARAEAPAPETGARLSPAAELESEAKAAPAPRAPTEMMHAGRGEGSTAAPAPASPSPAKAKVAEARPSRLRQRLKQALVGFFIVTNLLSATPAIGQGRAVDVTPAERPAAVQMVEQGRARAPQAASQGYVQVRDVNDLIARYDKDVKLYVMGDIQGMGSSEYRELAQFLSDKHWVVVLVEDASGSRYVDAEGRTHYDDDAVDYGTGQGIPRKADFKSFKNAETGEEDGAVLTIVMRQRVLLLHTSKAQDGRGMNGETQFKGNLDQWAVSNLRNGGNIEGAVKETVTNIDGMLSQKIAAEARGAQGSVADAKRQVSALESKIAAFNKAHPQMAGTLGRHDVGALREAIARAEAALARKDFASAASAAGRVDSAASQAVSAMQAFEKDHASAKESLAAAKADIAQLEAQAAAFRSDYPRVSGPLARPETKAMTEAVASAEKRLAADPAGALSGAQAVRQQASAARAAINDYPAGKQMIETAEARLAELQGAKRSSQGATELAQAKAALSEAREQYETGGVAWQERLEQAKQQLNDGSLAIAKADRDAQRNLLILLFSILGSLMASFGTGFFLRRRVKPVQAETEQLLTDWTTALDTKLEALIEHLDGKMSTYIGPATGPAAGKYVGETAKLAVQTREDIGTLHIIWGGAQIILNQAKALVYPTNVLKKILNYFFYHKYRDAVDLLKDKPVTFKPQDGVEAALGDRSKSWDEKLLGDITSYKPFSKSFKELMAEFHERAERASKAVQVVEDAILTAGPKLQAVEDGIAAVEKLKPAIDEAGAQDGLFLIPSAFSAVLPAAKAFAAKAIEEVKTDPVGGLRGSGAQGTRLKDDAKLLIETVVAARKGALVTVQQAVDALTKASVSTSWIESELSRLSGRAEALAVKAAQEPAADKINAFAAELAAFAEKTAAAAALTAELVESKATRIEKANVAIEATRMELGRKLGLEADRIMREADADPTDFINAASKQAALAQKAIGAGKLEEARKALDELARLSAEAKGIVDASKASVESHEKTVAARRTETGRIEGQVPAHEEILAAVSKRYAKSVLNLGAGDPSHPNGNGTVEDNVGETNAHIADSKTKVEKAVKVFREGKVLEAASLLAQVAAHQESAVYRLNEIKEKQARLERTEAANAKTLAGLDDRVKTYDREVTGDARTMKPTMAAYEKAKGELEAGRKLVQAAKGDPFKAEAALAAVVAAMDQVWVQARNDRDAHAEAERSLTAAYNSIQAATAEAERAKGDGHGDSRETQEAYALIDRAAAQYAQARGRYDAPHSDWNAIDRDADSATNTAAQAAATIRREMQEAEDASREISRAASKVREASNWTGSYGVYISGSPGSGALESARASLSNGDYDGAKRYAQSAYSAADRAIDEAEAEVASRRRAEEERRRREEEERRRREREEEERRNRSSGGGYGGGSGNGGGGWGGSSSGNGRSGW